MQRRQLVFAAPAFAAVATLPARAQQAWPSRPVTIVVGNAPGGATDLIARLLEHQLGETWKQPVVVIYKPGANTAIGTDFVAKSPPDGYTLGVVVTAHVINPSLRKNLPFDTVRDLSGISELAVAPVLLSASPKLPANNLAELIALAKKNPGKLTYASPGAGSSMHLAGELLKTTAGIDLIHVPYKGNGGAYGDVFAGTVDLIIDPLFSSLPHVKSGRLKPITTFDAKRSPIAADIPTASETLKGLTVESLYGMVVPSGTPRAIVHKLSSDMQAALQTPELRARMAEIGLTPVGSTPEAFDALIRREIDRWAVVVKSSGATSE